MTIGIKRMNLEPPKTISGMRTAARIAPIPNASSLRRLTRRRRPSYSSAGICSVFHERRHRSQTHRSPYGTALLSPHLHVIVIGGFAIPTRILGRAPSPHAGAIESFFGRCYLLPRGPKARPRAHKTEVEGGSGSRRGTTAPEDVAVVRRVRDLPRESGLSVGVARLVGRRPGRLGLSADLGNHGGHRLPRHRHLLRARSHVPAEVGRLVDLRERGLAQVHDAGRPDCDV